MNRRACVYRRRAGGRRDRRGGDRASGRGVRARPDLREAEGAVGERRAHRRFTEHDLQAGGLHDRGGNRRGRQDDGLRATRRPRTVQREPVQLRRDLDPVRPPRAARSASSRRRRTSSARATAASTTSRARSSAGHRCGRSTASRLGSRGARSRSAPATASPRSSSPCGPGTQASSPAGSGTTSIRRARTPRRRHRRLEMKFPDVLIPRPLKKPQSRARTAATARTAARPPSAPRRRRRTSSAGSTSARAAPASSPGCSSGRSRRGPTGSTRSARRPCSLSSSRR